MNLLPFDPDTTPLDELLYQCRELVEDPTFPTVGCWRAAGGKTLGHFQVYFPEELAEAAGLLPVKMRGAPLEPTLADSHFGSYLCSILKTTLELALTGAVPLDLFVSHPICDSARNLAAIWARNLGYPAHVLYLPQNPNSTHSVDYLAGEYARILRVIESVAGHAVCTADLERAIVTFNRNRSLMRELYAIKRDEPWRIDAADAYCLVALAGIITRAEHNTLLESVLPRLRSRCARARGTARSCCSSWTAATRRRCSASTRAGTSCTTSAFRPRPVARPTSCTRSSRACCRSPRSRVVRSRPASSRRWFLR